jgi:hypothetical protein
VKHEQWMSVGLMGVGFLYLFLISFVQVPATATKYVDTIIGFIMGTALATVINFQWGSSSGSAAKSETIAKELKKE